MAKLDAVSRAVIAVSKIQALGYKAKSPHAYSSKSIARLERRAEQLQGKRIEEFRSNPTPELAKRLLKSEDKKVKDDYRNNRSLLRRANTLATSKEVTEFTRRVVPIGETGKVAIYEKYRLKVPFIKHELATQKANEMVAKYNKPAYNKARVTFGGSLNELSGRQVPDGTYYMGGPMARPNAAVHFYQSTAEKYKTVRYIIVEFKIEPEL